MKYETKDFYLSCVLRALGIELLKLDQSKGNFSVFVFNDPQNQVQTIINQYWDKKLSVDARTFVETINELKTRLYNKND